jgi:hypothetical protein
VWRRRFQEIASDVQREDGRDQPVRPKCGSSPSTRTVAIRFRNSRLSGASAARRSHAVARNAGAAQAFKVCLPITFYDSNLEFPTLVARRFAVESRRRGSEPRNRRRAPWHRLATARCRSHGGSLNVAPSRAIKLYATTSKVPADFFAPTQYQRSRKLTQQPDTEKGPFWERFLAIETDPLTYEAQVSSITIEMDQVAAPRNVSPTELAALFGATAQQDGDASARYREKRAQRTVYAREQSGGNDGTDRHAAHVAGRAGAGRRRRVERRARLPHDVR